MPDSTAPSSREFWDEFEWEKELRKDDERVRTYLAELPKFIDLPQEDAVILKRIQCREELIPHGIPLFQEKWPLEENPDEDEDEEDRNFNESWLHRDGAETLLACTRLAREYSMLFVIAPKTAGSEVFLSLITILGKITARMTDVVELPPDELPALRIALCKRIVQNLNDAIGLQNHLLNTSENEEAFSHLCSLGTQLRVLREDVLNMLFRARDPGKKKK